MTNRQSRSTRLTSGIQVEPLEQRTFLSGTSLEPLSPVVETGTLARSGAVQSYEIQVSQPGWLGADVFRLTNVATNLTLELTGEGVELKGSAVGNITYQSEQNRLSAGTYELTVHRQDIVAENGTPTPVKFQMTAVIVYAGMSRSLAEQAGTLNQSRSFEGFAGILPDIGEDTQNVYELTVSSATIVTATLSGATGDAVAIGQVVNGIWTCSPLTYLSQSYVVQPGPVYVVVDSIHGPFQTYHLNVESTPLPAPSIDNARVVPSVATDLHLNELFGSEQINVPVSLIDLAQSGPATLAIGISASSDGSHASTIPISQLTVSGVVQKSTQFTLSPGLASVTARATVPTNLPASAKYYLVAQITGPVSNERLITISSQSYEYVGTPASSYAALFNGSLANSTFKADIPGTWDDYFSYVRNLLSGDTSKRAIQRAPDASVSAGANGGLNPASPESFIEAFEGLKTAPYLDGNTHPSIGIGINLNTFDSGTLFSSPTWTELKTDLASFNPANTKGKSDKSILTWLEGLAAQKSPPSVISNASAQTIFDQTWPTYERAAANYLGDTWDELDTYAQTAMTDMQFNGVLSAYTSMVKALSVSNGPDYLVAAFQIANSKSAYDPNNRGLNLRREAEFQDLLWNRPELIGNLLT
jgi:hypothetical protein